MNVKDKNFQQASPSIKCYFVVCVTLFDEDVYIFDKNFEGQKLFFWLSCYPFN